jgi:hypothetical protein
MDGKGSSELDAEFDRHYLDPLLPACAEESFNEMEHSHGTCELRDMRIPSLRSA